MSIGPIESFPPANTAQAQNPSSGSSHAKAPSESSTAADKTARPVSGTLPKQESSVAKKASASYELTQDVVEVHQDPEIKNQFIIQYLDQAKNVVLQVPSDEELQVERTIAQEFDQAAKVHSMATSAVAGSGSEGEKSHGD
jgi:hypothetical protein